MGVLRADSKAAGYIELPGAVKDADCRIVDVDGGVSSEGGCCNLFKYDPQADKEFSCGTCKYVLRKSSPQDDRDTAAIERVASLPGNRYDLAEAILESARKRKAAKK